MARLNLTVFDATETFKYMAIAPDDMPLNKIIDELVILMGLPTLEPDKTLIDYKLYAQADGQMLDGKKTLFEHNVKDGDILRLQMEISAS